MFGGQYQTNPGQADKIFFRGTSYGNVPTFGTAVDTEGVTLGKMQQENQKRQLDQQAGQAGLDRSFQGGQNAANRDLQLQLGMAPINFAKEKFNTLSPLLTNLIGGTQGGGLVGGAPGPQPGVTTGPVWTPQQVDQQVNAAKSNNATAAASQSNAAADKTAAQGFGSRSPLLSALQTQIGMGQMAANTDAERNIRFDTAKGNAEHTLNTEAQAETNFRDFNDQDIRRRQANFNYTTSLAGILAGLA